MGTKEFNIALDGDRPTVIPITLTVSRIKNIRGKPHASVVVDCGKAKRRAVEVAVDIPAPATVKRRKST